MDKSVKSGKVPYRHRSFMSRLSEAILSSPQRHSQVRQASSNKSVAIEKESPVKPQNDSVTFHSDADYSDEPGYSVIPHPSSSQKCDEPSPPPVPPKAIEAMYATVKKKHKSKDETRKAHHKHRTKKKTHVATDGDSIERVTGSFDRKHKQEQTIEKTVAPLSSSRSQRKNARGDETTEHISRQTHLENELYSLKLKHQEDIRRLYEEIHQSDKENEMLRNKVMELLRQETKWKHEMALTRVLKQENQYAAENNAELNRRIAKLEEDTKQEVQLLLEQVNLVKHEKEVLSDQLSTLQQEHHSLMKKYNKVCLEKRSMISVQQHVKELNENQKILEDTKMKCEEEIAKLRDKYISIEDEKNNSSIQLHLLKEENRKLEAENTALKESLKEVKRSKEFLAEKLEKIKQHESEALDLLASLLKVAEEVITERDIILKKSALAEEQKNMIHTTAMDYSKNLGRLQEHIANTKKRMDEKMAKFLSSSQQKDRQLANMKQSYEKQLEILKNKIVQQNHALTQLARDKRQLEEDLRNLWQAATLDREVFSSSEKIGRSSPQQK